MVSDLTLNLYSSCQTLQVSPEAQLSYLSPPPYFPLFETDSVLRTPTVDN